MNIKTEIQKNGTRLFSAKTNPTLHAMFLEIKEMKYSTAGYLREIKSLLDGFSIEDELNYTIEAIKLQKYVEDKFSDIMAEYLPHNEFQKSNGMVISNDRMSFVTISNFVYDNFKDEFPFNHPDFSDSLKQRIEREKRDKETI